MGFEQDRLGLALVTLIEDPEGATIQRLVAEALQASAAGAPRHKGGARGSLWVAPAPVSVKLRLFCLPYAGGVSENVFGRLVARVSPYFSAGCVLLALRWPPPLSLLMYKFAVAHTYIASGACRVASVQSAAAR